MAFEIRGCWDCTSAVTNGFPARESVARSIMVIFDDEQRMIFRNGKLLSTNQYTINTEQRPMILKLYDMPTDSLISQSMVSFDGTFLVCACILFSTELPSDLVSKEGSWVDVMTFVRSEHPQHLKVGASV